MTTEEKLTPLIEAQLSYSGAMADLDHLIEVIAKMFNGKISPTQLSNYMYKNYREQFDKYSLNCKSPIGDMGLESDDDITPKEHKSIYWIAAYRKSNGEIVIGKELRENQSDIKNCIYKGLYPIACVPVTIKFFEGDGL